MQCSTHQYPRLTTQNLRVSIPSPRLLASLKPPTPSIDHYYLIINSYSCTNSAYEIPNSFSKRSASIGYGKRFTHLISKSIAPSPHQYIIPTTRTNTAFSFGVSREKYEKVSFPTFLIHFRST